MQGRVITDQLFDWFLVIQKHYFRLFSFFRRLGVLFRQKLFFINLFSSNHDFSIFLPLMRLPAHLNFLLHIDSDTKHPLRLYGIPLPDQFSLKIRGWICRQAHLISAGIRVQSRPFILFKDLLIHKLFLFPLSQSINHLLNFNLLQGRLSSFNLLGLLLRIRQVFNHKLFLL
jgi:hypothetical protein